jgi:hypothetical protein
MSHGHIIGIALAVTAVASGCRPAGSKSDVKTLDQLASGKGMGTYSCAATPVENEYVTKTAMQKVTLADGKTKCGSSADPKCAAVKDVLSIIAKSKQELVQNYFDTIGGNILISNDSVAKVCQAAFSDPKSEQYVSEENRKTISGCWSIAQLADGSSVTTLVMSESPDAIRQGGIRIMGMFYGQAVPQMSNIGGGKFVYNADYTEADSVRKTLWDKKKELAQIFLDDVRKAEAASGGKYKLENLPLLDAKAVKLIRDASDSKSLVIDTIIPDRINRQRFVDTVMGEAFDSGFCQAAENNTANEKSFAGTMNVFRTEILSDLTDLTKTMGTVVTPSNQVQASNVNANSNQGFGLFGSGFFASLLGMGTMGNTGVNFYVNPANPTNNPQLPGYNPSLPTNTMQQPGYINPALNQNLRAAQTGVNIGMLTQLFGGLSRGNTSCPNCNVAGGCTGGNCGCPGGCSTCQNTWVLLLKSNRQTSVVF